MHGFCGIWGCVALAFFKRTDGIFYGGENAGALLGAQLLGCVCIIAWAGLLSTIFFFAAKKLEVLRLAADDEILGGDLHYFGPMNLQGSLASYDLKEGIELITSPNKLREAGVDEASTPTNNKVHPM